MSRRNRRAPNPPVPADDDPRFAQWINDVGPMQELEPPALDDSINVGTPLAAAVAVLVGAAGVVVALGWAALGFAINIGIAPVAAVVLLGVGTVLVIIGGSFAYLAHRDRQQSQ